MTENFELKNAGYRSIKQLSLDLTLRNLFKVTIEAVIEHLIDHDLNRVNWSQVCKTSYVIVINILEEGDLGISCVTREQHDTVFDLIVNEVYARQIDFDNKVRKDIISLTNHEKDEQTKIETIANLVQKIRNSDSISNSTKRSYDLLNRLLTKNFSQGSNQEKTLKELVESLTS